MNTFKKLMEENALADRRRQERIENDINDLRMKMREFADSLDKDMLLAIGAYGKDTYDWGNNKCREFENGDTWNNMRIIVSRDFAVGRPSLVVVLNGEHGLSIFGNDVETVVVGVRGDSFTCSTTDESVWTESDLRPDSVRCNWFDSGVCKITSRRMVGDNRTWFERCRDAMPRFIEEFSSYLSNRSMSVK